MTLDPPSLPGTRIVEVDGVAPLAGTAPPATIRYENPIRKLLVFARHEGVASAWRKARAKRLTRSLAAQACVVVVHGRLVPEGTWCVACGRQASPRLRRMLFAAETVFAASDAEHAARSAAALTEALAHDARALRALTEFDPHSGEPAPDLGALAPAPADPSPDGAVAPLAPRGPLAFGDFDIDAVKVRSRAELRAKRRYIPLVLVGAGDYTYACVLPALQRRHVPMVVVDYNPLRAEAYRTRFGFPLVETDYRRVLDLTAKLEAPTVVIATYHSQHTPIAAAFLAANPRASIFLEKPPSLGAAQTRALAELMERPEHFIDIGFNRRYAPMLRYARELVLATAVPMTLTCVVRELRLEPTHWYFWRSEGTRVYGNWCHWIDVATWFISADPIEITLLSAPQSTTSATETHSVAVRFADGSLFQLAIGDAGDGFRGVQETIDLRAGDTTIFIDDFKRMTVLDRGTTSVQRARVRDRGHDAMYRELEQAILAGGRPKYTARDLLRTMTLTETIRAMLESGERHRVLKAQPPGA